VRTAVDRRAAGIPSWSSHKECHTDEISSSILAASRFDSASAWALGIRTIVPGKSPDPLGRAVPAGRPDGLDRAAHRAGPVDCAAGQHRRFVFNSWYGVWGPRGLPLAVLDKLADGLQRTVATEEVRRQFTSVGIVPAFDGPAAFTAFMARDIERNAALLKAAKFEPE
jgi:hypothetical protein